MFCLFENEINIIFHTVRSGIYLQDYNKQNTY